MQRSLTNVEFNTADQNSYVEFNTIDHFGYCNSYIKVELTL